MKLWSIQYKNENGELVLFHNFGFLDIFNAKDKINQLKEEDSDRVCKGKRPLRSNYKIVRVNIECR